MHFSTNTISYNVFEYFFSRLFSRGFWVIDVKVFRQQSVMNFVASQEVASHQPYRVVQCKFDCRISMQVYFDNSFYMHTLERYTVCLFEFEILNVLFDF